MKFRLSKVGKQKLIPPEDISREIEFITDVLLSQRYIDSVHRKGLCIMDSPWQLPLPLERHTKSRVVVYFYSGSWIPIMFSCLEDAIKLHCQALQLGKDIVLFPADLDPKTFDTSSTVVCNPGVQNETNGAYTTKSKATDALRTWIFL